MKQIAIEDRLVNSPFAEPQRHFRFDDDGIADPWNAKKMIRAELQTGVKS